VEEKRVGPTHVEEAVKSGKILPLIRIHSSSESPAMLCFGPLSEFLFLDRRPGLDVQEDLFLLDVCLHPGGDRRKRDRSHCDGSYQLSKAAVGHGPSGEENTGTATMGKEKRLEP